MDIVLSTLDSLAAALELVPVIDRYAEEVLDELRDEPLPPGTGRALLERHFDSPQCVVLTARDPELNERVGLCITVPFEDPLAGDAVPMIVVLSVHPERRHRGLARALVEAVSAQLRGRGFPRLAARAGHNDDALISMGERWGFVRAWELMLLE